MNKLLYFLYFFLTLVTSQEVNEKSLGDYSQRFSDKVMEQRQCVSMSTGLDYLESSFSAIIYQYIRMYNDPIAYNQRQNTTRYDELFRKKENPYNIILDQSNEETKGTLEPVEKEDGNGFELRFAYPVNFTSKEYGKG